ncbi:MAG TPA: amidohydrolase [Chitinophagaceae bacterium]
MSTLSITLIQSDLHWEDKAANLKMFEEKINAADRKSNVIFLPEMFNTGFSMRPKVLAEKMDGPSVQWMQKIAKEKKVIIAGSLIIEDDGLYYNRLVWMLPNGQYGYYDKRHRFGYAGEDQHFASGSKRMIASVNGWKINLQVCYDLRFPVWARQRSEGEYDMLVYVANWPERRNHAWKTLLQARAIENQAYVVGVNRVGTDGNDIYYIGNSMIVDPLGEVIYEKAHEEDVHTHTITKELLDEVRSKFPFWKDADEFRILNPIEEKVE